MTQTRLDQILANLRGLQLELEGEIERVLDEKRRLFRYSLERRRVRFEDGVRALQARYRVGVWPYLRDARWGHLLTAPIIYMVIVPMMLLDGVVTLYQQICFRVYGIPLVRRSEYLVIDRQHLSYLNAIEKLNCMYCGYGNGLIAYIREVTARTEQYWCPIKHARRVKDPHQRIDQFVDYGDARAYRERLEALRRRW